ncbi:GNAT family N-acetyltransferase [Nocardia brasiliensis]|uniref:GNAT family N-acetyltransferase n=1 Tax=Nocardia brasiliensis TaxID=37326 RepID=UPI003D91B081
MAKGVRIEKFADEYREELLALSIRAWEPVFDAMKAATPSFVYNSFYPAGWRKRHMDDLSALLEAEPAMVRVAFDEESGVAVGWISIRLHPEDRMGEIYVLAVDPTYQRRGIASLLMEHAFHYIRESGMAMVMVETGDDPGHAPSRASYESAGFQRWPVARYFKDLSR